MTEERREDGGRAPERYPSVRQDDAIERTGRTSEVTGEEQSFDPDGGVAPPATEGRPGPEGDPAERKPR